MIGITTLNFTDTRRMFEGQPRELETVIWYPALHDAQVEKIEHAI